MKNVLKTTLKQVVNNDNLSVLGGIVIDCATQSTPNYAQRNLFLRVSSPTILKVISGNIYFTNSTGSADYGTSMTLSGNNAANDLYISNGSGKLLLENKYVLTQIQFPAGNVFTSKFRDYDFITPEIGAYIQGNNAIVGAVPTNIVLRGITLTNAGVNGMLPINALLTTVQLRNNGVGVSIPDLSNSNITRLDVIRNSSFSGAIDSLTNGKFTEFYISYTKLSGSIESFIEKDWALGRRSGNVDCKFGNLENAQSFNGVGYQEKTVYISFDANSVTVRNNNASGAVLGTYDGTSWTYA